jgi:putative ABC transport system substrate-binding protein
VTRRDFITLLGGAAATWPLGARAQRAGMRRIGVFTNLAADDPESQARIGAFLQGLQQSGWTIGSNVRIDYRWETTISHGITNMRRSWPLSVRMSSCALPARP